MRVGEGEVGRGFKWEMVEISAQNCYITSLKKHTCNLRFGAAWVVTPDLRRLFWPCIVVVDLILGNCRVNCVDIVVLVLGKEVFGEMAVWYNNGY